MNWLSNFIRPKINSIVKNKEVPDNLWHKCPSCGGMIYHKELSQNVHVCHHCGFHLTQPVKERLNHLFDKGEWTRLSLPQLPDDPLKFKDRKRYTDRLRDARAKSGEKDAIIVAQGKIGGQKTVIACFNFEFMAGSMGTAVGEGVVRGAELALKKKAAFIVVPASGGARMQEGILSLMQMPRTIIATKRLKRANLPYIVLLTNPTTGGVSASFAMTGHIHIAEAGATIGFAGKRVIEETIREKLPEGFQTAEYLLDHGMVDMVVKRQDLPEKISFLLKSLMNNQDKHQRFLKQFKSKSVESTDQAIAQTSAKK